MIVYYAHPMSWYDTERESLDLLAIREAGHETMNPNSSDFTSQVSKAKSRGQSGNVIMSIFFDAIESADAVAYRAFDDGYLGAGVAGEVLQAFIQGKTLFQILDTYKKGPTLFEQSDLRTSFGPRVLTIEDTRSRNKRRVM